MSANGYAVSVNLHNSHAATHFERYKKNEGSSFWTLAQETVRRLVIVKPDQEKQVEMGRPVGHTDLIRLGGGKERVFFKRHGSERLYPGVVDPNAPLVESIIAVTHAKGWEEALAPDQQPHPELENPILQLSPHYDLFSIFPGIKSPGLPDGNYVDDMAESVAFWEQHALRISPDDEVEIYRENGVPAIPPTYRDL